MQSGRRTRVAIAKWNQMTTLIFQTEGRHQTSPASLRGQKRERWTDKEARYRRKVGAREETEDRRKEKM